MRFISPHSIISTTILASTIVTNLSQPAFAQQLTEITSVNVRETESGIELILQTADGSTPEFVETPDQKILYIDLVDARLNLATGNSFSVNNPAATIESVTVSEEFAGSVSIIITGTETLPQVELIPNAGGGTLSVTTSPATAQTPATPPTSEPPIEEIEIIVTGEAEEEQEYVAPEVSIGRGNPQSVLDTVQSVQSVTEEVIEDQNINDLSSISDNVSGVSKGTIASQNAGTEFTIRGFSAVQGRENLLRNGLRDDTLGSISGLTNIERVEILKGPASVLYGQGVVGGTVNLVTKKPLNEPFYGASFTAGNFDTYRGSLDFTEKLDEGGLAYRLNVAYEDEGSFKDFQEQEFVLADLGLTLVQTENTDLYVGLEYQKVKTEGTASQLPASGTVIDNPFGEIDISTNLGEPSLAEFELNVTRLSSELEHKFSKNWKLQNQILGSFLRTPVSIGFEGIDSNFTETGLEADNRSFRRSLIDNPTKTNVFTANTNVVGEFNTGKIEHELIFGVEFVNREIDDVVDLRFVDDIDIFDPAYSPDSVSSFSNRVQDQLTKNNEIGLYLQDQINFTDNLILALGGRLDFANTELIDGGDSDLNAETSESNFSPRAGLIYKPTENISLYASYTESFLPNAGRAREIDPETLQPVLGDEFEPETGRQYEVGVKSELFDDKILATLALFDLERNNVLDAQTFSSRQIGEQRSRGVELDIAGEILPGWKIITSYAYLDTEILSDTNEFGNTDSSGNQLRNIPENAFNIWTAYTLQKGTLEGLGFGIGLFYEDVKQGDLENSFTLPDYLRTDAAIFYTKNQFNAQLNFQNLFDIRYFESARDQARVNPGAPFTVLGTLSVEF